MDAIFKITLFIMLVFFLISNAKAGKTLDDGDAFDTNNLSNEAEYTIALD